MTNKEETPCYEIMCENCHIELVIDLSLHEDVLEDDIKFCPFCGHDYNVEVNLDDTNFTDEYKLYDE